MWNNEWKKGVDYPNWGDTEVYKKTIAGGYLLQVKMLKLSQKLIRH